MRKSSYALAATGLVAAVTLSGATARKPVMRSFEATWVGTVQSIPRPENAWTSGSRCLRTARTRPCRT